MGTKKNQAAVFNFLLDHFSVSRALYRDPNWKTIRIGATNFWYLLVWVAALLLGRRFTGCEVDRKFIDIAVRRLVETDVPDPHPE